MPIIASAKKRVRTTHKAATRNRKTKRGLRAALKVFTKSPSTKSATALQGHLDRAAKKGVIHKNKAARLKSQAAAKAKASGVKPAKTAKKTVTKPKTTQTRTTKKR